MLNIAVTGGFEHEMSHFPGWKWNGMKVLGSAPFINLMSWASLKFFPDEALPALLEPASTWNEEELTEQVE